MTVLLSTLILYSTLNFFSINLCLNYRFRVMKWGEFLISLNDHSVYVLIAWKCCIAVPVQLRGHKWKQVRLPLHSHNLGDTLTSVFKCWVKLRIKTHCFIFSQRIAFYFHNKKYSNTMFLLLLSFFHLPGKSQCLNKSETDII